MLTGRWDKLLCLVPYFPDREVLFTQNQMQKCKPRGLACWSGYCRTGGGVGCRVCASPQLTFDVEAVVRAVGPHACFLSIAWYWVSGDRGKGQWPRGQENRGLQYGLTRVPDDMSSMEQGMPVGHSHWHCGGLCLAEEVGLLVPKGAFSLSLKAGLGFLSISFESVSSLGRDPVFSLSGPCSIFHRTVQAWDKSLFP